MALFRTMEEEPLTDITRYPAYAALNEEQRKEVDEAYRNAFLNSQRFGIVIANGMAFETAKALCEKHIGFAKLQGKLEAQGHSKESAGAIAASIGDKKYGAKAMHKAARTHTPLGECECEGKGCSKCMNEDEWKGATDEHEPGPYCGESEKVTEAEKCSCRIGGKFGPQSSCPKHSDSVILAKHDREFKAGKGFNKLKADREAGETEPMKESTWKGATDEYEPGPYCAEAEADPEQDAGSQEVQDKEKYCDKCGCVHAPDDSCSSTGDNKAEKDEDDEDAKSIHGAADILSQLQQDKKTKAKGMKEAEWMGEGSEAADFQAKNDAMVGMSEAGEPEKKPAPKPKKRNWRDDVYRDLGMKKVKGARGGTYYESEEIEEAKKKKPVVDTPYAGSWADTEAKRKAGEDKVHKGFHPPGYDPKNCPACAKHVEQHKKGETASQLSGGRYASEYHKEEVDPMIAAAANYISYRADCVGTGKTILESKEQIDEVRTLSRDPFARQNSIKKNAGKGSCDFCGGEDKKLYQYGTDPDVGKASFSKGKFCSKGCHHSYHN